MKVVELKTLAKERGLRGYSRLKKAEFITFLQNNLQPTHLLLHKLCLRLGLDQIGHNSQNC